VVPSLRAIRLEAWQPKAWAKRYALPTRPSKDATEAQLSHVVGIAFSGWSLGRRGDMANPWLATNTGLRRTGQGKSFRFELLFFALGDVGPVSMGKSAVF